MSMLVRMAAMALTWSDLERSKLRTRIFQRAVTWKRLQIGPWLPLKLNRKSLMLFQRAPVAVTWSDLAKPCPWSKAIGNGIYCAPWHSASSYPILPLGEWDLVFVWFHLRYYYPIPPIGEWDLVFVWFHLRYYYYYYRCSSSS